MNPLPSDLWTSRYDPGVPVDLEVPTATFDSLVIEASTDAPGHVALDYYGHRLSYAELSAESERVAAGLQQRGIGPGSQVAVALPHCLEWAVAHLAVWRSGATVVAIPHDWVGAAWRSAVDLVHCDAALVTHKTAARLEGTQPSMPLYVVDPLARLGWSWRLAAWLFRRRPVAASERQEARRTGGAAASALSSKASAANGHRRLGASSARLTDWTRLSAESQPLQERTADADSPALITLRRQGLPDQGRALATDRFTHRSLLAGASQLDAWLSDVAPGEATWLLTVPPASALGVVVALGTIPLLRARWVITPSRDLGTLIDVVDEVRPSHVLSDAASIGSFALDPALVRLDSRSVRAWLVGGPVEAELCRSFEELCDIELCQGLAGDAVAGLVCCNPVNGRRVAGSVGLPLPGVSVGAAEGSVGAGNVSDLTFIAPNMRLSEHPGPDAAGQAGLGSTADMDSNEATDRPGLAGPGGRFHMDDAGFVYVD